MTSFIITAFNRPLALRTCLASLCQQTQSDWIAHVVDNSDPGRYVDEHANACAMDSRIHYNYVRGLTTMTEPNPSGHKYSLYKATEIGVERRPQGDWLCFPNDDSYYCPWFLERMLHTAEKSSLDLVYCDIVMGGAGGHHVLEASPKLCCIDKTNFLLRRGWWQGFPEGHGDGYPQADGLMIVDLVRRGIRHGRVPELLVVHN